ncbi:GGDEF domain-containing protein [Desulfovibrio sulfodismutans]|uniref:diguanylate cyclase n=1 Tax=Desulfolutivibrio sulfodismutans TaxID=63561 RepID=A0A7K3NHS6_9BACT|nr:GGDEF domain-containing protein [Desulfolutivibrio sulfodismutans]NDY55740.1 GGDEF domain-containing protein [Desulfolutivibrio sulfodismutans]QLA13360.1 diguanylate cyclase [Desulfolutivibrio sulfodismutans DSM 3696]
MTKFALTWRYASALLLLAALAGGSYLFLDRSMDLERRRAVVIDLSVRQRMLAQSVVILGFVADRAAQPSVRDAALGEMQGALRELLSIHARLGSLQIGDLAPPDADSWLESTRRLDVFVNTARTVARQVQAGKPLSHALIIRLHETGGLELLAGLDALLLHHQSESGQSLFLLDRLPLAFFLGTLAILAFMGVMLFRPLVNDIVADRRSLEIANEELGKLATVDCLTGLFNRRKFDEVVVREMELARRYADHVSLLMFDIDHFKTINDTLGHAVGDKVLADLGRLAVTSMRSVDYVFRWGGEEFLILAPRTDDHAAFGVAEKLRQTVAAHWFSDGVRLTISLGVAEYRPGEGLEDWLTRVDQAMYAAKRGGRNKTMAG